MHSSNYNPIRCGPELIVVKTKKRATKTCTEVSAGIVMQVEELSMALRVK